MSNREFSLARPKESKEVNAFYERILDHLEADFNYPNWTRDIHPSREMLERAIKNDELFLLKEDGKVLAGLIANGDCIEEYSNVNWSDKTGRALIIHLFAVDHTRQREGIGSEMIKDLIVWARENAYDTIHLDTIIMNTPAMAFYENLGFKNLGQYILDYKDSDEKRFILYEYDL